jgi:hypothetical protein
MHRYRAMHPKGAGNVYVDAWMSKQRDCRVGLEQGCE